VIFIPKKDGTQQMCVYYHALNEVTIENKYPLSRIDDLFDQLCGDISKTTFISRNALYKYTVISFELTNTPAYLMDLMNKAFMESLNKFTMMFIDGILVYSKSKEEHEEHLRLVLQKLQDHRLYAKLSQCEFWMKQVSFLSHVILEEGMPVDSSKI
jgi:hypothetical protein